MLLIQSGKEFLVSFQTAAVEKAVELDNDLTFSAHLENHLADGQRFDVPGVNIFAHLGVRDPIAARPTGITLSQV